MTRTKLLALLISVQMIFGASLYAQQRTPMIFGPNFYAQQRTQKPPLHAKHWMAITGKPLAATAGAMIFQKGGNAVDAACAMIAATCTMWDTLGWGGETQALIYNPHTRKVVGINALGVAPTGATPEFFRSKGMKYPPEYGPLAAVTPGTPGGILVMLAEFGKLSLKDVLEPAIQMADGYPIEAETANLIEREKERLKQWPYSRQVMLPHLGEKREAPEPGEIFRQPDLAATLRKLVEAEQEALKQGKSRKEAIYAAYDRFYKGDIAREIVRGAYHNLHRNLLYYRNRGRAIQDSIEMMEQESEKIETASSIATLMGVEGRIREIYYGAFTEILRLEEPFRRVKRPPDNMINALISFSNSLLYAAALSQIYRTPLNPTISFLHEPGARRFSLALDIAEIFKPIIVDKIIFKLINKSILTEDDLMEEVAFAYLKEKGRKAVVREFEERLQATVRHRRLRRNVSYRGFIRLECYKLVRHLLGIEPYRALRAWW